MSAVWTGNNKGLVVAVLVMVLVTGCLHAPDITITELREINPGTVPTAKIEIPSFQPECRMSMYFIDVGQGDSEYMVFPNGKTMLVDTGAGTSYSDSSLSRVVQHIDTLVITHDHADHTGGLEYLETHYRFPDALTYSHLKRGNFIHIDDANVTVEVMNPGSLLPDEENDRSVVLLVTYNNVNALLTGDVSTAIDPRLYSAGQVDILKVAHHGSRTSTSKALLAALSPRTAIISVGKNTYGHPSQDTLSRLAGISTYRTDRDGTIRVCTDGETYSVSSFLK